MVLVKKRNFKKMILYSLAFIIVAAFGAYMIYNSMAPSVDQNTNLNVSTTSNLPVISDFSQELFNQNKYKTLKEFGASSLPIDTSKLLVGNESPFTPSF